MDSGVLKLLRQLQNKNQLKFDRKLGIFAIFLVLATFLWFLNALSKQYTATISYPVKFKNFPEEKVLVNKLPEHLDLKVSAYGYTLFRYNFSTEIPPISFDVNSFYLKKAVKANTTNLFIVTQLAKEKIEAQLQAEMTVLEISPDTIFLQFATMITKKVAIKPVTNITFREPYKLLGKYRLMPDSIEVSGPSSILDTIQCIYTQKLEYNELDKDLKRNIALITNDELQYSEKRVIIEIPVDKFTEKTVEVPVSIKDIPDEKKMILFPDNIKVTFQVASTEYSNAISQHFGAFVDYNDIELSISNKLKVILESQPENIYSVRFEPAYVEYIIEK